MILRCQARLSAFGNYQDVERFLIATDCVYTLCNATLIFAAPTQNWWQHWIVSPFFRPTLQLVGGIPTPLKNISQIGSSSELLGKIKNVPNHQPDKCLRKVPTLPSMACLPSKWWEPRRSFLSSNWVAVTTNLGVPANTCFFSGNYIYSSKYPLVI